MNKKALHVLIARLREPSTWAAVAVILGMTGVTVDEGQVSALANLGTALAAAAAIFLPEQK